MKSGRRGCSSQKSVLDDFSVSSYSCSPFEGRIQFGCHACQKWHWEFNKADDFYSGSLGIRTALNGLTLRHSLAEVYLDFSDFFPPWKPCYSDRRPFI